MTKTFLLGVGCQKGGTTWLYDYLMGSPSFAHGYRKEYHVFDALDLPSEQGVRNRLLAKAQAASADPSPGDRSAARASHRLSMYLDPELYVDYFTGLLHRSPETRLVADMTPAYGMLSADRFRSIRDGFAARGVRTLPVFLMRDPVERIWSQVRMHARLYDEHAAASQESAAFLLEHHATPAYARRTRYDQTLATLDEVFAPDEVFHGFYEQLFTEATTRRLCEQAGIDFVAPDVDKRVHASPTTDVVPESTVQLVAEHYREVYVAVQQRFPEVALRDLWPSSRHVLAPDA
ncbi:sulfotransferase [Nocardioides sp.]|uniref:sulfotransferase n=1 Tax=Nocardioides sp. TaxID=35761 RepID=UPI00286BB61D|nr:sulfotransferase [Nocardioides sp.]